MVRTARQHATEDPDRVIVGLRLEAQCAAFIEDGRIGTRRLRCLQHGADFRHGRTRPRCRQQQSGAVDARLRHLRPRRQGLLECRAGLRELAELPQCAAQAVPCRRIVCVDLQCAVKPERRVANPS